jgi:hypothetical protein
MKFRDDSLSTFWIHWALWWASTLSMTVTFAIRILDRSGDITFRNALDQIGSNRLYYKPLDQARF